MTFKNGHTPWNKGKRIYNRKKEVHNAGWFKNGHTPWNTGLKGAYVPTKENRKNYSISAKKRWRIPEIREKIMKANNKVKKQMIKNCSKTWIKKIDNGYKPYNYGNFKTGIYHSKNNGEVRYRCGWEHKVMRYLDANNIEWEYEGKNNRFYLETLGKYYLNDFYLPKENKYIQVKGYLKPNDKYYAFKKEYFNLDIELWNKSVLKEKGVL